MITKSYLVSSRHRSTDLQVRTDTPFVPPPPTALHIFRQPVLPDVLDVVLVDPAEFTALAKGCHPGVQDVFEALGRGLGG